MKLSWFEISTTTFTNQLAMNANSGKVSATGNVADEVRELGLLPDTNIVVGLDFPVHDSNILKLVSDRQDEILGRLANA
jgi:hypothetical protein